MPPKTGLRTYCVRMFSATMYYMCDLDVASLAHELVFLACLPMAQTKNMTCREGMGP